MKEQRLTYEGLEKILTGRIAWYKGAAEGKGKSVFDYNFPTIEGIAAGPDLKIPATRGDAYLSACKKISEELELARVLIDAYVSSNGRETP